MEQERNDDQRAISDFVADDAADDDAKAESREASAADIAQLVGSKSVFGTPVVKESAADREADAGGKDRHEPAPQQPISIGGHCIRLVGARFVHRSRCPLRMSCDAADVRVEKRRNELPADQT